MLSQSWKSNNFIGSNKEKSNIAIALLEKFTFLYSNKNYRSTNNIFVDNKEFARVDIVYCLQGLHVQYYSIKVPFIIVIQANVNLIKNFKFEVFFTSETMAKAKYEIKFNSNQLHGITIKIFNKND